MSLCYFSNADIITMDPHAPRAQAMLVDKGRIVAIGDPKSVPKPQDAEAFDLEGMTVIPGFNDNHLHAIFLGQQQYIPSLAGLSAAEIVETLRERFADVRPGKLVMGSSWDYPACPNPSKELIDAVFPNNPVALTQYGGHGMWLNSRALELLRIDRNTPDPPNGAILKDANGEPTGVVRELGINRLASRYFLSMMLRRSQRDARLDSALQTFAQCGITSVQDNTWFPFPVYSYVRYRNRGRLTARFSCWSHGEMTTFRRLIALCRFDRDWVRRGPRKFFIDGSFTTRTAWLTEPYADEADSCGAGKNADEIEPVLESLAKANAQGAFHAIGDRAVHEFLDAYERVAARHPAIRSLRMRIEHAQMVTPGDVSRIRDLGVMISAQPAALGSPEKDAALLGAERAQRAYPYRSLLNAGVHVSFGSDVPGEFTCDPLTEIDLIARRSGPERISVEEALRCYTVESAYVEFQEHQKGMLRESYLADFTVLSNDVTRFTQAEIQTGAIARTKVLRTVVGGRTVYEANRMNQPRA